ncbi:MAG: CHRD domain-containing protein [Longimicrobiales bacterium]
MRIRLLLVPLLIGGLAVTACEDDDDPAGLATSFSAALNADNEVPPNASTATGTASFEIDGDEIDFTLTTTGLTGVTAAHIHGPALSGENATVIVPLFNADTEGDWDGSKTASFDVSDIASGQATTTMDALIALMRNGRTYVNVHTDVLPAGVIRGQITSN